MIGQARWKCYYSWNVMQSIDTFAVYGRLLFCWKCSLEYCSESQYMWLKDVLNVPLGCQSAVDPHWKRPSVAKDSNGGGRSMPPVLFERSLRTLLICTQLSTFRKWRQFHSIEVTSHLTGYHSKRKGDADGGQISVVAHVVGMPNVLQQRVLQRYGLTEGRVVKELSVFQQNILRILMLNP